MNTIEALRARGHERTALATTDGTLHGYINQELLADKTVYALVGETPETAPDLATVVAISAITAVAPAD
jgi:hypothetical protein